MEGYMTTEEADQVMRRLAEGRCSSHLVTGSALKHCSNSAFKDHSDSVLQQLSRDIKNCVHPAQLAVVLSCLEILLLRIAVEKCPIPSGLAKVVGAILYHQSSSVASQCVSLHCLSVIISLHPASSKDYRPMLLKWAKIALFCSNTSLMKEAACVLQALNCYRKAENVEETQFFASVIQSLHYCIDKLSASEQETEISEYLLIPDTSLCKGTEKIDALVKGVNGLSYLIETCLLTDTCCPLNVPLHQLWSLIWKMMTYQISVQQLKIVLLKTSWQLLLVTISSLQLSLLPYSDTLEAAVIKTLEQSLPTFIVALVCKCVGKWVCLRGGCPLQITEDIVAHLCLQAYSHLERIPEYDRHFEKDSILSLFVNTIYTCLEKHCRPLSPRLIKSITGLCYKIGSSCSEIKSLSILINSMFLQNTSFVSELDQTMETLSKDTNFVADPQADQDTSLMSENMETLSKETNLMAQQDTSLMSECTETVSKEASSFVAHQDNAAHTTSTHFCTSGITEKQGRIKTVTSIEKARANEAEREHVESIFIEEEEEDEEELDEEDIDAMLMDAFAS